MLGEPAEYPGKMVNAIIQYMKKQKGIKKAFLRLMAKESEPSYMIVVDFEGNKDELFKGIAEAAAPYLNGMALDLAETEMAAWMDYVKSIRPF